MCQNAACLIKWAVGLCLTFLKTILWPQNSSTVLESTSPHACHDNSCNGIEDCGDDAVCCPLSLPGGKSAFHPPQICPRARLGFGTEFCKWYNLRTLRKWYCSTHTVAQWPSNDRCVCGQQIRQYRPCVACLVMLKYMETPKRLTPIA